MFDILTSTFIVKPEAFPSLPHNLSRFLIVHHLNPPISGNSSAKKNGFCANSYLW
jgi:hypothetical protein